MSDRDKTFIGMLVTTISFVDEGVDEVFDFLQKTIGLNAAMPAPYSHADTIAGRHYGTEWEPARDHGKSEDINLVGGAFFPPDERYYRNTTIRDFRAPDQVFADDELFSRIVEGANRRGIQLFPYILDNVGGHDSGPRSVPGFSNVLEINLDKVKGPAPCINSENYRSWIYGMIEDLIRNYNIAGILWGMERKGPFDAVFDGAVPYCFCDTCCSLAAERGINVYKAQEGYRKFYELVNSPETVDMPDGPFIEFIRLLFDYPQILEWETFWTDRYHGWMSEIYSLVHWLDGNREVGFLTWAYLHSKYLLRAQFDFRKIAKFSDWVLPLFTPNMDGFFLSKAVRGVTSSILNGVSPEQLLPVHYALMGFDEGPWKGLGERAFTANYTKAEVKRIIRGLGDGTPVYPGIGIGFPTLERGQPRATRAQVIENTKAAFEAGAPGIAFRRSYVEMPLDHIRAAGEALREIGVIK
ncbi:hypothetical protein ACFLS0_00765 [Candidatus Bipolaricaulota bacterium]